MHFKVFTVDRYFSKQATQVYYFSRDSRSVAMAAVYSTFFFRFSFHATTPLSLEPYFTEKLLSSPSTSLSRNDRRFLILSPKMLLPSSSLSKASVFLNQNSIKILLYTIQRTEIKSMFTYQKSFQMIPKQANRIPGYHTQKPCPALPSSLWHFY